MTEQNPHDSGLGGRVDPILPAADGGPAHDPNLDQANAAATGAPAAEPDDLQSMALALEVSKAKASENYDLYLRSVAEMENIRRRSADEVTKAHKYAIESFAEAMVPVRDSLEMALKVENPTVASLLEGVEATLRQLAGAFDRNRLIELNPVGEKFDPNKHQAISMVPGASTKPPVPANHIVAVLQKGYLINDRILRPALVTVAQG
jgi:molecular chaperone GrpE